MFGRHTKRKKVTLQIYDSASDEMFMRQLPEMNRLQVVDAKFAVWQSFPNTVSEVGSPFLGVTYWASGIKAGIDAH